MMPAVLDATSIVYLTKEQMKMQAEASNYTLKARSDVLEIAFELRVEVGLLKYRLKALEQELRLLQLPKNENWSA